MSSLARLFLALYLLVNKIIGSSEGLGVISAWGMIATSESGGPFGNGESHVDGVRADVGVGTRPEEPRPRIDLKNELPFRLVSNSC